jgi:predicted ATPase
MITRLRVNGFKNLVDVDVYFRAFNVITGSNGIGKSNLFEVIRLVSLLRKNSVYKAAKHIRGSERNFAKLFAHFSDEITEVNISIGVDFKTEKKIEYQYGIEMNFAGLRLGISIDREILESPDGVLFGEITPTYDPDDSLQMGLMTRYYGISELSKLDNRYSDVIKEIDNWHILNLDPSVIRMPSDLNDLPEINSKGENVAAALRRIKGDSDSVLNYLSNRLFELTGEIMEIRVRDDANIESIWIEVKTADGTWHNARALSEGTLRFLTYAILEIDSESSGVYCIEEPENGIHPSRIPALLRLLEDISSHPNRQVIVNTHSPLIAASCPEDALIIATSVSAIDEKGQEFTKPKFCGLKNTWREGVMPLASVSALRSFLDINPDNGIKNGEKRIADRDDVKRILRLFTEREAEA